MPEHRKHFALKGKREYISKVNIPSFAYPNQHTDTEIPHGSKDHVTVPDTRKNTFKLVIVNGQNTQYC